MKATLPDTLERGRIRNGPYGSDQTWGAYGAFIIDGPCARPLKIISSGGEETRWEHVSVSTPTRPPNWQEMCFVKDLFWSDDECVMQLHPPKQDYVNNDPYCLHMWRPLDVEIPRPQAIMVGDAKIGTLDPKRVKVISA